MDKQRRFGGALVSFQHFQGSFLTFRLSGQETFGISAEVLRMYHDKLGVCHTRELMHLYLREIPADKADISPAVPLFIAAVPANDLCADIGGSFRQLIIIAGPEKYCGWTDQAKAPMVPKYEKSRRSAPCERGERRLGTVFFVFGGFVFESFGTGKTAGCIFKMSPLAR